MKTGHFAPTRWTMVLRARGGDPEGRAALSELCEAYYAPVLTFLRGEGRDEDAARELAHGFFERLLSGGSLGGVDPARGRFRGYLLGAVKHFLGDRRERDRAEKRGGGMSPLSLEESGEGLPANTSGVPDSERAFDRQWALTVIARALAVVEAVYPPEEGKPAHFEVLKPWITAEGPPGSQAAAAARLGMSEGAVKVAIHRLRARFREAVKAEISQTVPADSDVDGELRHLISVLSG